ATCSGVPFATVVPQFGKICRDVLGMMRLVLTVRGLAFI
ncbi:MAG: hypothetical protein ACI9NQ_001834, partial [Paracoccaceae bacterium]